MPNDENAIYRLSRALDKLSAYKFPARLTPAVRDSLRASAVTQTEARARAMRAAADSHRAIRSRPSLACDRRASAGARDDAHHLRGDDDHAAARATMRCPSRREATVNCRIMPVDSIEPVHDSLRKLADGLADVELVPDVGVGPEVPQPGAVREAVEKATHAIFGPEVPVVARIGLGASDSRFLRKAGILAYGIGVWPSRTS